MQGLDLILNRMQAGGSIPLGYMNSGGESEAMASGAGNRCENPNSQAWILLLMGRIGQTSIQKQCVIFSGHLKWCEKSKLGP